MGIDIGFDIFPPLGHQEEDRWVRLLQIIESLYSADPVLVRTESHLEFKIGEHPLLDLDCTKFRRFSSKISGRHGAAETYLKSVYQIARMVFGDLRVHWWSDYGYGGEPKTKYTWREIWHPPVLIVNQYRQFLPGLPHLGFHVSDVVGWVLNAFEQTHIGMDGLRLSSADFNFPDNNGYRIVQETMDEFTKVNSVKDWTVGMPN
mmetsp:Transcript_2727/g.3228  ORF Transcript_2727/g.3228 Transcript_2727/m.3228 type:complete len:204 (+) Transcript_2727:168-779(+)